MKTLKITLLACICTFAAKAQNFTGTWTTTFGEVRLVQEPSKVYGDYDSNGVIEALQTGATINGKFNNGNKIGTFFFTLSSDSKSFVGKWRWLGETTHRGEWNGTLKSDAYPSLKMDKWTGQYEFKSYPNGFTKKLNVFQKGFKLEGTFEDGKSFFARLSSDLKMVLDGSFYNGTTQYSLYKSQIKIENSENITVWYGEIGKVNTSEKTKFSAKFLKPMTRAEFASLTGVNPSATNNQATVSSSAMRTRTQRLELATTSSSTLVTGSPVKESRYRLTLDKIYVNAVDDGPEGIFSGYELFGIAWCRAYDATGKQIQPFDVTYADQYGRFWEVLPNNYIKTNMRTGAQYEIAKQITFDFPMNTGTDEAEVLKKSKIELTVELKDYDTASSSDILGKERIVIALNEANIPRHLSSQFPNPNQKGVLNIKHGKGHLIITYYIEKI